MKNLTGCYHRSVISLGVLKSMGARDDNSIFFRGGGKGGFDALSSQKNQDKCHSQRSEGSVNLNSAILNIVMNLLNK